jgi:hypothetical protein
MIFYNYEKKFLVDFQHSKILTICNIFYKSEVMEIYNGIKPFMLHVYNMKARGIDINNQFFSYYFAGCKSLKWYRPFFFAIEVCVSNAWVNYHANNNKKLLLIDFRTKIIDFLNQIKLENRADLQLFLIILKFKKIYMIKIYLRYTKFYYFKFFFVTLKINLLL